MIDNELINNYKRLKKYDIDHLFQYVAIRYCHDYESSISDDIVSAVTNISYECFMNDNNDIDINNYTGYILDSIYTYGATLKQIQELDSAYVIECYNNGKNAGEILKLDISDMEYSFTDINNHKYYLSEFGFYETDEAGIKIHEPHPMEDPFHDLLEMIKDNKVKQMTASMHYNLRCAILEYGLLDDEDYKDNIKGYEKYCEENFVNSKIILREVGLTKNIDLFDLDNQEIKQIKRERLYKILKDNHYEISNKYLYVASLNNGNDYYYNNEDEKYLIIDKENGIKKLNDIPFFILNELKNEQNYIYINGREIEKVLRNLSAWDLYKDGNSFDSYSFSKFKKYIVRYSPRYSQMLDVLLDNSIENMLMFMSKIESDNLKKE